MLGLLLELQYRFYEREKECGIVLAGGIMSLHWGDGIQVIQEWRDIDRNVSIPGEGIGISKASTVRGHKERWAYDHSHEFNFRYNELDLLLRYTGGNVSQADVSSGLVFWISFDTRDIDLGNYLHNNIF